MREYIVAVQMMELVIIQVSASPARGVQASDGEVAGWVAAGSVFVALLGVVICRCRVEVLYGLPVMRDGGRDSDLPFLSGDARVVA